MPDILARSSRKNKRYSINMGPMIHHSEDSRYEDYTQHNDKRRKSSYLARHSVRENWSKDGIHTSGFGARYLLWDGTTIGEAIDLIETRFKGEIINKF